MHNGLCDETISLIIKPLPLFWAFRGFASILNNNVLQPCGWVEGRALNNGI